MTQTTKKARPRSAVLEARANYVLEQIAYCGELPLDPNTYDDFDDRCEISRREFDHCIDILVERGVVEFVTSAKYFSVQLTAEEYDARQAVKDAASSKNKPLP